MDNWVIFLLVNVVLVIVLGVITNLITPSIKSTYDRSVFSSRQKRIATIIKDYQLIKEYKVNSSRYIARLITLVAGELFATISAIVAIGISILSAILTPSQASTINISRTAQFNILAILNSMFLFLGMSQVIKLVNVVKNVNYIDDYKEKTRVEIKKLGGNPEELDKEEEKVKETPNKKQYRR